jgi:tetratricopeptide (TPR) repeat protein
MPNDLIDQLPSEQWNALQHTLEAFEEAWRRGERPDFGDYLPRGVEPPRALLMELAHLDLELRLKAGEAARVDAYLGRHPQLAEDRRVVVELIAAEFEFRRRRESDLTPESYLTRFPAYRAELSQRFGLGAGPTRTLQSGGALEPGKQPTRGEMNPAVPWSPRAWSGSGPPLPAAGAEMPAVPGYEILEKLGEGGMGVVYKARQLGLKRLVALKMMRGAHASAAELTRFRAEAEAVARLQHPNIVQIYEVGERGGQPFLSLEFVEGTSLDKKLRGTPLAVEEAARDIETLARTMHTAHQRGIIHRDLKPANILLTGDGSPKITDFGLAKQLDQDKAQTQSGAIMGTPSYMAPEQAFARTEAIGPATDVYALGAILYEMLSGRPPFQAALWWDTLEQVCSQEPVPPSRLQPKVPRDLETICLKCLQKEPVKRYASAEALADDLRRFLTREPILARPVSLWERTVKWTRRKPAVAALVGASLLAACALVAFSVLFAIYQAQQTDYQSQRFIYQAQEADYQAQQADIYKQQLQRVKEQEEVRERIGQTLLRAQQHEAAANWNAANTELEKAQEALDALRDVRADELRADVRRRLGVVRQRLQEQEQGQQARKRLQDFKAPYDDALFYYTLFTGLDVSDSRIKTRSAARTALAIYGLAGEAEPAEPILATLDRDRLILTADEHTRLAEGCYELLLIWAETEAALPGKAELDALDRQRAAKALTVLARAAQLGQVHKLETRTYHLRKGRYTARSKGEPVDPAALERTAPARPTGALDWFLEGLERYRTGQHELASQACAEVLRRQENHFWARYVQGLCHLRLGRWLDGKAQLTFCITRRPAFVWPRLLRGFAASELGFKYTDERLAADEFKVAEEDFDLALKQDQDPVVQYVGLANRGVLNIRRQHWPEAVADLRQAVQANPSGFQAYVNLALALQGQAKWDEAQAVLGEAIRRAPNLAIGYESRARLHLLRKNWAGARADFEQAIRREPRDSKSERLIDNLVELGRLWHRERNYAAALASFDRALHLQPDFVLTQRFRAETLLALNRPDDAGQALDRYLAVTREPATEVYQARGLIHAGAGQLPAAIEMYTLALRKKPRDTVTRCYRGWSYLLTDAVPLALKDFETCLAEDATNTDALIGRGNARVRLRQLDDALEDAEAAVKQGGLTDRLLYNLARLYAQVVGQLEAETRSARPNAAQLAGQRLAFYKQKALDALGQTLEKLPEERRAVFWHSQVQTDPALTAIRRGSLYAELAARYGGKGS